MSAQARAFAKINLCLHAGERRADNYHALASLVTFAESGDELRAEQSASLELSIEGPFAAATPKGRDNLVLKAANELRAATGAKHGARLALTKNLPVASGLGGGSADAAAALRLLNSLWRTGLDDNALAQLGRSLGADVPACVHSRSALIEGIGEKIAPLALPRLALLLVNPGVELSTAAVFAKLDDRRGAELPPLPEFADASTLVTYLRDTGNDLEAPAKSLAPVIAECLSALSREPGCLLARMSGSGATCFGIFEAEEAAAATRQKIAAAHPGWWTESTRTR